MSHCIICTYTGKEVNPLDLRPEDIDIRDIAHSLALVNRFAGHTRYPISVAQHSVYVSRLVEPCGQALAGLLHDGTEAYLGDMTHWMKRHPSMALYREAEDRAQRVIAERFQVHTFETPEIDWADRVMVRFEGKHPQGIGSSFIIHNPNYPELTAEEVLLVGAWRPWSWRQSEQAFLTAFRCLENGITDMADMLSDFR